MLAHAIRPAQLRALLLLLVLVPLVPTVLLLRFSQDAVQSERESARIRTEELYQQILDSSGPALNRTVEATGKPVSAHDVSKFYEELFAPEVRVSVLDSSGALVAGSRSDQPIVAQTSVKAGPQRWSVRLHGRRDPSPTFPHDELAHLYGRSALLLMVGILAIAVLAGITINRQLTLQDLKSTAVATVAHELRTPLASIRMLIDTLLEGRCRTEQQRQEYLELISRELERLTRVTEQFLTHSRLERGKHGFHFAELQATELAQAAVQMLESRIKAPECTFHLQIFPDVPPLRGDRGALVMVLVNLLENALKYTGREKTITLRVRRAARAVLLEVMDNGIGMSAAEAKTIFRPFRQADQRLSRSREGCGLGLSIVYQIVEAHGGTVTVDSNPGRGSCFTVRLPIAVSSRAALPEPAKEAEPPIHLPT